MLYPDADHYRVLGARPEASTSELRRNMALLIRWLHPDQQNGGDRSVFTTRITRAWNELKTEDRRTAYDLSRRRALEKKSSATKVGAPNIQTRLSHLAIAVWLTIEDAARPRCATQAF